MNTTFGHHFGRHLVFSELPKDAKVALLGFVMYYASFYKKIQKKKQKKKKHFLWTVLHALADILGFCAGLKGEILLFLIPFMFCESACGLLFTKDTVLHVLYSATYIFYI